MLRIGQRREGGTSVIEVEGQLSGPWVSELGRVLAATEPAPAALELDLEGVGYVDAAGEQLLRDAISRGARLRARSGFVAALLAAPPAEGAP